MARLALTTIGARFGVAIESTAGTQPSAFHLMENCYSVGGSTNEADQIDVTPLEEDKARRYAKGLGDSGGSKTIGFFNDGEGGLIDDWNALKTASETARESNKATWGTVWFPGAKYAYFFTFEPGELPLSDVEVAAANQLEISNTVNEEKGWLTAIKPESSVPIS